MTGSESLSAALISVASAVLSARAADLAVGRRWSGGAQLSIPASRPAQRRVCHGVEYFVH